ncbi:hypothetical protein [Synechococcus sp. PCC 7336]|uniref:hypothetical protein n=1 Tax=Synechococcus sp. PCC 7336 TaxID=195250 RepID=UPI0003466065|nr:hypothetical protein [Synechococcus sp. PCC 7336]
MHLFPPTNCSRASSKLVRYFAALAIAIATAIGPAAAEPEIEFDPPNGTRLSDFDAFLTITVNLDDHTWETLPWDWQRPQVWLNGTNISLPVQSLIAGATASVLTPEKIVVSSQTFTERQMSLSLSGLRLEPGFNRLVIEVAPTSGDMEPLKIDVSYPVIAGQGQVVSRVSGQE